MDKVFDKDHVTKLKDNKEYDALFSYCQDFSTSDDPEAIYELSNCYYYGYGTEVDYKKSFYYTYKAAFAGLFAAQKSLAFYYANGYGVEQNNAKAMEWFLKSVEQEDDQSAEQGYGDVQVDLALWIKNSCGAWENETKSVDWYTEVKAKSGNADSQYNLAVCYENGYGVKQNYAEAVEWYIKAAEQGNSNAQNNLAVCYVKGYGVNPNKDKAVKWYTKAAEQGNAVAQFNLAICYENGYGVEQNYDLAAEWFAESAIQGHSTAQYNLALCFKNGYGVEQNYDRAVEWYKKSADQGNVNAQFELAVCYQKGYGVEQNNEKAVEWYIKAAEQGDAVSQVNLANCFENGYGVEQNKAKAVEWYTKASEQGLLVYGDLLEEVAENGDLNAQYRLATSYYLGDGMEQNYAKAVEWFTKVAERGNDEAQLILAICYAEGTGVESDDEKAFEWFYRSASQSNKYAQYHVALYYETGKAVNRSIAAATKWYTKSAEQGCEEAIEALERLNETNNARLSAEEYEKLLIKNEMIMCQLMTAITELKQDNIELRTQMQSVLSTVEDIGIKIDSLIDFIEKSLPIELEKQQKILSMELLKINSSIEQNEETVAEWNKKMDEYICENIHKYGETNEIIDAEYELCRIFDKVWYKMDNEVRTSLVSSRVMWLKCKEFSGSFDYSGVCITATAALESLLTKVFLKNFQEYLQNNEIPKPDWPATLVYNDHGTLKSNKFFTLGNLKYLLGDSDEWSDGKKWTKNRKTNLENYLNSIIKKDEEYKDPRDVFIKKGYNEKSFLERCEEIRIKYRNEAAHTNCVDKQIAEQCYNDIIGVSEHLEKVNNIIWILFDLLKEENI